jgi:AcrR family transcriptional regulator
MNDPISTGSNSIANPPPRRGRPVASPDKIASMREKIAKEARALFLADGYRAISMRRIAAGVGCTPMSLYSYYPRKIDILRHLWSELFEALFADLELVSIQTVQPVERLNLVSLKYVNYWLENPEHYRMVFMTEGVSQPDVSVFVNQDRISAHYRLFHMLIGAIICAEEDATTLRAEALICALNGIAHNLITISGYTWSSPRLLVNVVVKGLIS